MTTIKLVLMSNRIKINCIHQTKVVDIQLEHLTFNNNICLLQLQTMMSRKHHLLNITELKLTYYF